MAKKGLDPAQKAICIQAAKEGKTLEEIRQDAMTDRKAFYEALEHDPSFNETFAQARQFGLEELSEQLLTYPDTYDDVQKARLKSDNVKWILSKRKPSTYGDRVDINITTPPDLNAAIEDARKRTIEGVFTKVLEDRKQLSVDAETRDADIKKGEGQKGNESSE